MEFVNFQHLIERLSKIKEDYQSKKPYRYVLVENFFHANKAELVLQNYPSLKDGKWDGTTYLNQKNKFQKRKFEENSVINKVFKELNSPEFIYLLQEITQVEDKLTGDDELFGAGLHQSISGAYLNIHLDFNRHPKTKYHRRVNVLIYMNSDWKDEYEGHLELWDFSKGSKTMLNKYEPTFNRCVIFETNEISYHGHPKPLKTPMDVNRKSLTTYYYTQTRPANETAKEHTTIFVNTEGMKGNLKKISSGMKALLERVIKR